ncbi:MAG: hypothetical protein EXR77_18015 [Myxococcales bacterium]|nr:hypothetical protein [Myxococcales bacterium]
MAPNAKHVQETIQARVAVRAGHFQRFANHLQDSPVIQPAHPQHVRARPVWQPNIARAGPLFAAVTALLPVLATVWTGDAVWRQVPAWWLATALGACRSIPTRS